MIQQGYKLSELAEVIHAQLQGNPNCIIHSIAPLQFATSGQLSFLDNPRYRKYLSQTAASAVIMSPREAVHYSGNALLTGNPYLSYAQIAELFSDKNRNPPAAGIHPTAVIGSGCQIHASASVGPLCVLGANVVIDEHAQIGASCVIGDGCSIGAYTQLRARAILYQKVCIGKRVTIHSGAVLGSDGFGFAKTKEATWYKVPQLGGVLIGDDVEIGANTTIDCGALGDTIIEEGVKIDNQIQIAHNVHIGAHTAIAGCVGISGSTTIGKRCVIGGGTCVAGHLTIADDVMITGMAMVTHSLPHAGVYSSGTGIFPNRDWQKNAVRFGQLDDIARRLRALERIKQ